LERRRRVILYGSSLFMAGLHVSLQRFPDLDISAVEERGWHALQPLIGKRVDAVVFDLSNGQPEFVLELIKRYPAVVLIGVDPTKDRALVLSSQQPQVLTMQDLVQAINGLPNSTRR
jgi:DNA-binding NarL/FixJ family response regulator